MYAGEAIKRTFERMTGIDRPSQRRALSAVRGRRPQTYLFGDDGKVPNNPTLPLVCYRKAVRLSAFSDPAAAFEELFAQHGWEDSWRNGIYDYTHYHSGAHEVLGVARGPGPVQATALREWSLWRGRDFPRLARIRHSGCHADTPRRRAGPGLTRGADAPRRRVV